MRIKGIIVFSLLLGALLTGSAWAEISVPLDDQLRILNQGRIPARLIPGAKHRIAVFTFEDADGTGLGDAAAALVAREILTNSKVSSIGVIFFEGGLAPSADSGLSYFDKVERVTAAQEVTLAAWGIIRETAKGVQIDTYLQIPAPSLDTYFSWTLKLPQTMGAWELSARLRPDRVLLQRRVFTADGIEQLRSAAAAIGRVRADPRADAEITADLPLSEVYYLTERQAGWVRLETHSGVNGWAPTAGHCQGECKPFLEAATFTGQVLRYMAYGSLPTSNQRLSLESQAVADQLEILALLNSKSIEELHEAANQAHSWQRPETVPPGGAAFANLEALAVLGLGLKEAFVEVAERDFKVNVRGGEPVPDSMEQQIYDSIKLSPENVKRIASPLAKASQYDPRNTDVLGNLSVLFGYVGDADRADLAQRLAVKYAR